MGSTSPVVGGGECSPRPHKPLNELKLTEYLREIHAKHQMIDYYTREGRETELFMVLSDLESLTHKAQIRLNEIRFGKS